MPFKHVHVYVSVLKPLQLIYSDVWGLAPVLSTTGPCYYISFLNDATKYLWLFPFKLKYDAYQTFIYFQNVVERQFDTKIKALQSDWGGEFRSLHKYLHSQGINHRITCPYTYQQAGAIERRHRQIVEVGLSLLAHSKLPQIFWENAFLTVVYIINRLLTPLLNNISPYKMVHKHKPDYNFFCAFGCTYWPYLRLTIDIKWIFDQKTAYLLGIVLVIKTTNV
jgi:histone deacetylase 1/2